MTNRVRVRRNDVGLSPSVYWPLFRLSPLLMLIGMVAGGWLAIRSILVWGVGGTEYVLGVDIPISATILALWAGTSALLLLPPQAVRARSSDLFATEPVLVWQLGRRFRAWNLLAVPLGGLLGAMVLGAILVVTGWTTDAPVDPVLGVLLAIVVAAFPSALIWIFLRGVLHGVELTPSQLIARGYFFSRRFSRRSIVSIDAVDLTGWASLIVNMFMNGQIDRSVQLSFDDGSTSLLLASNSHEHDLKIGIEIVRAWRAAVD